MLKVSNCTQIKVFFFISSVTTLSCSFSTYVILKLYVVLHVQVQPASVIFGPQRSTKYRTPNAAFQRKIMLKVSNCTQIKVFFFISSVTTLSCSFSTYVILKLYVVLHVQVQPASMIFGPQRSTKYRTPNAAFAIDSSR